MGARVTLTDRGSTLIELLQQNVQGNAVEEGWGEGLAPWCVELSWGEDASHVTGGDTCYRYVLAADCIYQSLPTEGDSEPKHDGAGEGPRDGRDVDWRVAALVDTLCQICTPKQTKVLMTTQRRGSGKDIDDFFRLSSERGFTSEALDCSRHIESMTAKAQSYPGMPKSLTLTLIGRLKITQACSSTSHDASSTSCREHDRQGSKLPRHACQHHTMRALTHVENLKGRARPAGSAGRPSYDDGALTI